MTTFKLQFIRYHFSVTDAPDLTYTGANGRRYTVRPRNVRLFSDDAGRTISTASVEGPTVRKDDGKLGNSRLVPVGPRDDPPPAYVNDMLASLGLRWSGGAR